MFLNRKHKKRLTGKQIRKRRQNLMFLGLLVLTMACTGGFALMTLLNSEPSGSRYTYTTENDIWYVQGGEVAVAAAQVQTPIPTARITAEPAVFEDVQVFLPTQTPTAQPHAVPAETECTAIPAAAARTELPCETSRPEPEKTIVPMPEMEIAQDIAR